MKLNEEERKADVEELEGDAGGKWRNKCTHTHMDVQTHTHTHIEVKKRLQ